MGLVPALTATPSKVSPSEPTSDPPGPAQPAPASSVPPKRSSRRLLGEVAAAVIAVVVVLALVLAGVIPLGSSGSGTVSGAQTSSEALADANSFASGVAHGPWVLYEVVGVGFVNTSIDHLGYNSYDCTVTGSSNVTIPASTGPYSTGKLSVWSFEYLNGTRTGVLFLQVTNGRVAELLLLGADCLSTGVEAPITVPFISSDIAANAALNSTNISAFVQNHSSANALVTLVEQEPGYGGLQWLLTYTTCSPIFSPGVPVQGSYVQAFVNASTGLLVQTFSEPLVNCAFSFYRMSQIPISEGFAIANPTLSTCPAGSTFATDGCTAGDYTYSIKISLSYLWFSPTSFWVDTASGGLYTASGPGGFSVLTSSGSVAAQAPVASETGMAMPHSWVTFGAGISPESTITTTDTILLDMGTTSPVGLGLTFEAMGPLGAFSGNTAPLTLP